MIDFFDTWGFGLLGGGFLLVAALINRFAPEKRRRIRHAFTLYVLFLVCAGGEHLLRRVHVPAIVGWGEHARLVAQLLAALTVVNLSAIVVFELGLPALGIDLVAITADIVVGFAYVFAALGVLKAAGASPSSVVTTSAIASGVLALGLQTTLSNVIGGIALQLDGSLHVGDWVKLSDGAQGKIVAIRWRHTVVETRDWDTVIVPNASLLAQNIVILGKRNGKPMQHRMWVYFNVDFRYSPSTVISAVQTALWAAPIEGVADEPKPSVICYDFAKDGRDSFGYYAVRYWLTDLPNDDPTSSRIRTRIHTALRRAGIPLARPSQTLFFTPVEDPTVRTERHHERGLRAIGQVDIFQTLTPAEREFVAGHLLYAPFTAGETVTKQGAVAHWLYLLCQGKVEIVRHGDPPGLARVVATIEAPGFFGEMGVLAGDARRADVIALTDVECYRLDKAGLEQILHERPEIAEQISRAIVTREVGLESVLEGLDEEGRRARMEHAQSRILEKIQSFFGLAPTTTRE